MDVCVWGAGYVGLTAAVYYADYLFHQVVCLDIDENRIDHLRRGVVPFHEPDTERIMQRSIASSRLAFGTSLVQQFGDVQVVAVGTPSNPDGSTDLTSVYAVIDSILQILNRDTWIVIKSTVPVGTCAMLDRYVQDQLMARSLPWSVSIISNPEFLSQGRAWQDMRHPDRIVIGGDHHKVKHISDMYHNSSAITLTNWQEAEMIKYVSNAMLATRISLMNECANFAENFDINFERVRWAVGNDSRIGHSHITPGVGYGGSCLPKDVASFIHQGQAVGSPITILQDVQAINDRQHERLLGKIKRRFGDDLVNIRATIWGVAFKADTDDVRNAKSIPIIKYLLSHGATVEIHDKHALFTCDKEFDNVLSYNELERVVVSTSLDGTTDDSDMLIILTNEEDYKWADFDSIYNRMRQPVIFGGTNLHTYSDLQSIGFEYYETGSTNER